MLQDRERHARECAVLAGGIDNQVGFPLVVKAALFPVGGGGPRIVDVPYKLLKTGVHRAHELDLTAYFGQADTTRTRIQIAGFREGPSLGHQLSLVFNDNFIFDRSPANKCVEAIHGGRGFHWRDNLLAVRHADLWVRQYQDVTPRDVEAVRKYFQQRGNGEPALAPEEVEAIRDGLRELCGFDMART